MPATRNLSVTPGDGELELAWTARRKGSSRATIRTGVEGAIRPLCDRRRGGRPGHRLGTPRPSDSVRDEGRLDLTWMTPTGYDIHYTSAAVGAVADGAAGLRSYHSAQLLS